MVDDGAGERILGVGVDVHLDDPIINRLPDLPKSRSRPSMKNQSEACPFSKGFDHGFLSLLQDRRLEFHLAGLINPMYVSKGRRQEVARPFDPAESAPNLEHVFRCGVELFSSASLDPILHPSNDPGLNLKDDFILMAALDQFDGDFEVLLERQIAPVEQ